MNMTNANISLVRNTFVGFVVREAGEDARQFAQEEFDALLRTGLVCHTRPFYLTVPRVGRLAIPDVFGTGRAARGKVYSIFEAALNHSTF